MKAPLPLYHWVATIKNHLYPEVSVVYLDNYHNWRINLRMSLQMISKMRLECLRKLKESRLASLIYLVVTGNHTLA